MQSDARISNRLKHASTLWERYVDSPAPRQLDRWLAETLRADKRFGSQDRRFYSDVLFAAARFSTWVVCQQRTGLKLQNLLRGSEASDKQKLKDFCQSIESESQLWSQIQKTPAQEIVAFAFETLSEQSQYESTRLALTSELAERSEFSEELLGALLLAHGIPPAWARSLKRRIEKSQWSNTQLFRFLQMQNVRPPLWIRLNASAAQERVHDDLTSHGLTVEWQDGAQNCARVSGSFGVYQADSFKEGLFEVQDWASQQISHAVQARPGQKIWDACAGGGGKSVALAASLAGKGALYASDIREHKLVEAKRRCQRAGFHNIRTLAWDGQTIPHFGKEISIQAGFDAVLVDAPCSSSGTWRRNPDARLRIGDNQARQSLYTLQKDLLTRAAGQLRRGGRLVYGTCSWCVEENEDVFESVIQSVGNKLTENCSLSLLGAPSMDSDTMFAATVVLMPDSLP